jgi:inhibitor of cysteine peptidase
MSKLTGSWTPLLLVARIIALVSLCLLYSANAVCSPDSKKETQTMQLLVEQDNGRTINLHLGESVQLTLPENATTGYRWAIDHYDKEIIEMLATEPHYQAPAIGSAGEVTFIFQTKKIGTGEIVLKHWRHWEGDASVIARFRVQLHIQP